MNNKTENYAFFAINYLEKHGIPYILETSSPSQEDMANGDFGYFALVRIRDASGIISDSTDGGQMFFSISFRKVDEFLEREATEAMGDKVSTLVFLQDFRDFLDILTDEKKINSLTIVLKNKLKEDLGLDF